MDPELRALERKVAADPGAPRLRLRLSTALERAGRRREALEALLPALALEEIRGAVAGFPAWESNDGDAGRTRFLDVRGIVDTPRVVWSRADGPFTTELLLASPLGVVVQPVHGPVQVLDAETGATRWGLGFPGERARLTSLAGGAALVWNQSWLEAHDVWSAHRLLRHQVLGEWLHAPASGFLLTRHQGELRAHGVHEGSWGELWSAPVPPGVDGVVGAVLAGPLVLISAQAEVVALDRQEGRTLWSTPGRAALADTSGVVVEAPGATLELRTLDGALTRRESTRDRALALTPTTIVTGGSGHVRIHRREDGAHLGGCVARGLLAATPDVLYLADPGSVVAASALTGETLWRHRLASAPEGGAPLPGRVVVVTAGGEVVCLGGAARA